MCSIILGWSFSSYEQRQFAQTNEHKQPRKGFLVIDVLGYWQEKLEIISYFNMICLTKTH